ncbi:UNVERIFIED_CONTAM: hypothetical protein PYX00_002246 [Menopon gallinae]|uniref:Venom protein n=1 Tax=Menopon gallinae TaxID=328185 RepID=A0AAW2IHF8_9NEOP
MIATVILSVILFAASARADEASPVDLQQDIQLAQNKIRDIEIRSKERVKYTETKLEEAWHYTVDVVNKYATDAYHVADLSLEKVNLLERKYIGEAIDKNKNINAFKCIVNVRKETNSEIMTARTACIDCIRTAWNKNYLEMDSMLEQVSAIQGATEGLYEYLYNSLQDCRDNECISKIVYMAEDRFSSLEKVLQRYLNRAWDLVSPFSQELTQCTRLMESNCGTSVTNCESKMKSC